MTLKIYECKVCLCAWEPRFENPKKCPCCKSSKWRSGGRRGLKCEGPINLIEQMDSLKEFLNILNKGDNAVDIPQYNNVSKYSIYYTIKTIGLKTGRKFEFYTPIAGPDKVCRTQ